MRTINNPDGSVSYEVDTPDGTLQVKVEAGVGAAVEITPSVAPPPQ